jgi:hypothetical protein
MLFNSKSKLTLPASYCRRVIFDLEQAITPATKGDKELTWKMPTNISTPG